METIQDYQTDGLVDTSPSADFSPALSEQEIEQSFVEDGMTAAEVEVRTDDEFYGDEVAVAGSVIGVEDRGEVTEPSGGETSSSQRKSSAKFGQSKFGDLLGSLDALVSGKGVEALKRAKSERPSFFYGGLTLTVLGALAILRLRK